MSPEIWAHIFKSRKSEKPCMEHWAKKFGKIASKHVQNTFGHFWKRFFGMFGILEIFCFFPSVFYKSQKLSPENWTQILQVRKTELIFLRSGIWTHNFQSRRSEMELRTLTLAVMQKNDCCVMCRQTELIFLVSGIWTLYFKSRKSEMHCVEHWAKKNFKNIAPKLVQNTLGHFGKPLKAFFELCNFFDFFENFRRLYPPWNIGKKLIFPKKPQNTFGHLGTI